MRIVVAAVGRLKRGPESDLAERYRERAVKSGRGIGLRSLEVVEIAESRAREPQRRMLEESIALANVIPKDAATVLLDPRGETLDSNGFTKRLRGWNDGGRDVAFVIGGPDGLAPTLSDQAGLHLAFGALTWPHQLVRIMLLEQIYRATTILSGHPYHRE
jgi:23S rRNA (pseudouridine1915-N3)-methyltransferase